MSPVEAFGVGDPVAIGRFEREHDLQLPAGYRDFLAATNGGQPSPNWCYVRDLDTHVIVDVLFGLGLKESLDLTTWMHEYRDELPPGAAVIGGDPGGNLFLLETLEENRGVYYWDHTHAFASSSEEDGNTYLIAASFETFLASLTKSL